MASPPQQQETRGTERHLITGGGGYLGCRLALSLARSGRDVLLVDQREPELALDDADVRRRISFKRGDITDLSTIVDHFRNVTVAYHLASYGMSGKEQFQTDKIKLVNIQGTENVIRACVLNNVKRLVYTSTYNVVFHGQPIENGDESLPYIDTNKISWDHYACTKTIAERKILAANGTRLGTDGCELKTCSLRMAGIYGPGEQRFLPRAADVLARGLFIVNVGSNPVTEFVHVDNVVLALTLADRALSAENDHVAAGQAYFISDGKPLVTYEFFRPLADALNVELPRYSVPVWLAYYFGFLIEMLYVLVHRFYDFTPYLTRAEVNKIGVTHYFSLEKARQQLLYEPLYQNDLSEVAALYRQKRLAAIARNETRSGSSTFKATGMEALLRTLFGLALLALLFCKLPMGYYSYAIS